VIQRGRPKKCPPFFPHFANASRDSNTIEVLENENGVDGKPLGNNGYAFWFKLLEMLRVSEGMYIDCRIPANWKRVQSRTRLSEEDVTICINVLCTMGAINADYWNDYNVIWCDKFLEHLQDAGCKDANNIQPPDFSPHAQEQEKGKTVEESAFGPVVIDEGWQRIEQVFAEQIGELPMGVYMDTLMEYYGRLGADVIEIAIKTTNENQPANPRTYLMRILEKWMNKGITTAVQAQAEVTEFKKRSKQNEKPKVTEIIDNTKWV